MSNSTGLSRSLGSAVAAIAIVSVVSSILVLATMAQLRSATRAQQHSTAVIRAADAFLVAMLNQEVGVRGYLLTGRATSLEPYRNGRPALERALADLRGLTAHNPVQAGRLAEAEAAARAWQRQVGERVVQLMADPAGRSQAQAIESTGQGKHYFDLFRARLGPMKEDEDRAASVEDGRLTEAGRRAGAALWLGSLLTLLICAAVAVAIRRRVVRPLVRLAETMEGLARGDLAVEVPGTDGGDEVGAMARAVEVFKQNLLELNRTSVLRATADTLPALLGYVDAQRRIGFLNGEFARWFDLPDDPEAVAGRRVDEVFGARTFPGAERELPAALAGRDTRFEHRLSRRGLGGRELEAFYRPHRAPDGRVLGAVTLLTDITERKRMERRLARQAGDLLRSNEELEQFAYVASHDLKAPLRGIENLVSWVEEDLEGTMSGDVSTNMALIKSRVRRLESLLDDLLAYSRAGRMEATTGPVDTRALVEELAELVSPPEGFRVLAGDGLPVIEAARAPLTQALQNLIGNAIKHHDHPADGQVRVDAVARDDEVEFTVTDDGPGIEAKYRERVFGMFQTLKPRDEVEGSGMGLAIVKKLVERAGGTIGLGEGPGGRGLAVRFTWPARAGRTVEEGH